MNTEFPKGISFSPALRGLSPARQNTGFTLLQLALALAGLLFLSLAVPAWVAVRVNQARVARAERDARAIAEGVRRFEEDNGFLPAWAHASGGGPGAASERVDLLVGPGALPRAASEVEGEWLSSRTLPLEGQLIENSPGYELFGTTSQRGWRGAYLASPVPTDPWGNRYLVSLGFEPTDDASAGGGGQHLWVLSAGPNGIIETPYPPRGTRPAGDDLLVPVPPSLTAHDAATRIVTPEGRGGYSARFWVLFCK